MESPQRKKLKSHESKTTAVPKLSIVQDSTLVAIPKSIDATPSIKVSKQSRIPPTLEKTKKKPSTVKLKPQPKEDKEDAYIAYLESKLGIDKSGKKKGKKTVEEDGLDGTLQCFLSALF